MDIESLRDFALSFREVEECTPFGLDTLVYKVGGKMFLLFGIDEEEVSINVKCNPEKAIELREQFDCVLPGYHMNKKHWNTIKISGNVSDEFIKEHVKNSYNLVVSKHLRK